eukprot:TRINITY_DN9408_c0_g1_i1.p1 TRINITY_DN9408_c0_g1~~TRINITY_DN9408_c0_g1_i1.p1  ORF type:complete len:426 (-),score=146.48 TRINITY_DN9408_c0_g1_i1:82-1359(-)
MGAAASAEAAAELNAAVAGGDRDRVVALLLKGAPLDQPVGDAKNTALHIAASKGNTSMAELLLNKGALIHAKNSSGETPLLCAARVGAANCAAFLISRGADIQATTNARRNVLHLAAVSGLPQFVQYLLKHGAPADALDQNNQAPWSYAKSADLKAILSEAYTMACDKRKLTSVGGAASYSVSSSSSSSAAAVRSSSPLPVGSSPSSSTAPLQGMYQEKPLPDGSSREAGGGGQSGESADMSRVHTNIAGGEEMDGAAALGESTQSSVPVLLRRVELLEAEVKESECIVAEEREERRSAEARAEDCERQRRAAEARGRAADSKAVKAYARVQEMKDQVEALNFRVAELERQNKELLKERAVHAEEAERQAQKIAQLEEALSQLPEEIAARDGMSTIELGDDDERSGPALQMASTQYYSFDNDEEL